MFVKIMSGEDAPDCDARKTYSLFDNVTAVDFTRNIQTKKAEARMVFTDGDPEIVPVEGNAYVMNEAGDTIACFGSAAYAKMRERN